MKCKSWCLLMLRRIILKQEPHLVNTILEGHGFLYVLP